MPREQLLERQKTKPIIIEPGVNDDILDKGRKLIKAHEQPAAIEQMVFQEIMFAQILPGFMTDLRDVLSEQKVSASDIDKIIQSLTQLIQQESDTKLISAILATPPNIRKQTPKREGLFVSIIKDVIDNQQELSGDNIYQALKNHLIESHKFIKGDRFMGYHTSNNSEVGASMRGGGGCPDSRSETPVGLVYYADAYQSLYGEKNGQFLYCVVGNTSDKNDPSRGWYWNHAVDVVTGPYSIKEIQELVTSYSRQIINESK